jgi:hypothetical protein
MDESHPNRVLSRILALIEQRLDEEAGMRRDMADYGLPERLQRDYARGAVAGFVYAASMARDYALDHDVDDPRLLRHLSGMVARADAQLDTGRQR